MRFWTHSSKKYRHLFSYYQKMKFLTGCLRMAQMTVFYFPKFLRPSICQLICPNSKSHRFCIKNWPTLILNYANMMLKLFQVWARVHSKITSSGTVEGMWRNYEKMTEVQGSRHFSAIGSCFVINAYKIGFFCSLFHVKVYYTSLFVVLLKFRWWKLLKGILEINDRIITGTGRG